MSRERYGLSAIGRWQLAGSLMADGPWLMADG